MSTRPEATSDRLVNLLSQWLARHVSDDEVRRFLAEQPLDDVGPDGRELAAELRAELEANGASRGDVEMLVRETLEALALGA
jgi:tripartite-type tricarboxylate transporter receptor subunit TctC